MSKFKHFTISGDKHYINRVAESGTSIPGVISIVRSTDTAAVITFNPQYTDLGGINKALRNYRSEKKEA